ncbi:hypothetical protein FSP39_009086 [Pinctada imbricata]|uniref:CXXC-type domain-containing protein n=1 Tax=Pinctada imbricata TaxID=66713 RepID=A0AA89C730_PINIB|nr:hypothetical protein FSP39_009086 [Pinctada imbricata]
MYLTPEEQAAGVRLKRRRRCGQCGPCQVKENCNKCHYCVRKDVLKQTCVYRKCVYLRSKPKPYMRNAQDTVPFTPRPLVSSPPQTLPASQSFISSPEPAPPPPAESAPSDTSLGGDAAVVKTPPVSVTGTTSHSLLNNDVPVSKSSSDANGATTTNQTSSPAVPQTFPFSVPQPQRSFQMDNVLAQNPPFPGSSSTLGSNTIQPVPIPPSFDSAFSNNHSIMPSLSNSMEKTLSDYSNQRFSHPHLHMPFPHPIRDSQSMMNIHYPGYSKSLTEARPNARSPCMYGPSLPAFPSAMSAISGVPFDRGPIQPSSSLDSMDKPSNGTTYLPNNTDIFRQYPSLPAPSPAFGYTSAHSHFTSPHSFSHSGYPPASTYSGYSGFGMPPPPSLPIPPAIPGNSSHLGPYSASSALSSLNQTHGCPKNGQHPPASLTLVTHQTQANYGCINSSRDNVPNSDDFSQSIVKDHYFQTPLAVVMETSETTKLAIQQEGVLSSFSKINVSIDGSLRTVISDKVHRWKAPQQPRILNVDTICITSEATEQIRENESRVRSDFKTISDLSPSSTEYMDVLDPDESSKNHVIGVENVSNTHGDGRQLKSASSHRGNNLVSCCIPRKSLSKYIYDADRADGMKEQHTMTRSENYNQPEAYVDLLFRTSLRSKFNGFEGDGSLIEDTAESLEINTKIKNREDGVLTASYSAKLGMEAKDHYEKYEEGNGNQGQKVTVMETEGDAVLFAHVSNVINTVQ